MRISETKLCSIIKGEMRKIVSEGVDGGYSIREQEEEMEMESLAVVVDGAAPSWCSP